MAAPARAIRATVVAPEGRVDLSLPAGVTIAEVSAELTTRLGLDSGLALCSLLGTPLPLGATVREQISDGSVLQLTDATDLGDLHVHDDVCEAVQSAVTSGWSDRASPVRSASMAGCALALVVGLVAAVTSPLFAASPGFAGLAAVAVVLTAAAIWWSAARPDWAGLFVWAAGGYAAAAVQMARRPTMSLLVDTWLIAALLGAGCATILLPRMAIAFARFGSALEAIAVKAAVDRGHAALLIGVEGIGVALVLLVPISVGAGPAGALLALDVAIGFLLLARSLPRPEMVWAVLLLGSVALFSGIMVALASHETWQLPIAVLGALTAGGFALCGLAADRMQVRLTWLAERVEWLSRVLLLPLGVWAVGLLTRAQDWGPR